MARTDDREGYRYSLDPFLLVDFAAGDKARRWIDLGTGAGVMPVLLAGADPRRQVVGVEIQAPLAKRARRMVAAALVAERVEIVHGDLRECLNLLPGESFDALVSNPPYRKPGSGRIAPDGERAAARHELHGGLADFISAARYLLKPGGRCYLIYLPERLAELLTLLTTARLEPKRLRCVHGRVGVPASMILVEARKGGRLGLQIEPPLMVFEGAEYSPEVAELFQRWRGLLPSSGGS